MLCGLSGGVDSSVVVALLIKVIGGIVCVHVDHVIYEEEWSLRAWWRYLNQASAI